MNQRKYTIDFRNVTHFLEMHAVIVMSLDFPDYYGCNWDAFWDCMRELHGAPCYIEIFGLDVIERLFDDDASIMLSLLKDWKQFGAKCGREHQVVIVRGDKRIEIDEYPIEE